MRLARGIALLLVIFTSTTLASAKAKKAQGSKAAASSMDSNDPVVKETSDEGPFAPGGKAAEEKKDDAKQHQDDAVAEAPSLKPAPRDPVVVFGNVLIGFGKGPEAGPDGGQATGKTTAATFMVGGRYDVSEALTFGARLPFTVGSARQVDGSYASAEALGALELMGEYRETLSAFTLLPIDFGLGLPTAQGAYDDADGIRRTQLNEVADAASGYRDPELFGPKRLPVIAGVGIDYAKFALSLHAATKLVAGIKVAGKLATTTVAGGSLELKSVTLRNVTSAGVAYRFLDKPGLFGALDSWLAYNAVNAVEYTSNAGASGPTRFQVVFEPRVGARVGKLTPSVGYVFPIGGRLADNSTSGLELHCDVTF
jgi:hypothetical protein